MSVAGFKHRVSLRLTAGQVPQKCVRPSVGAASIFSRPLVRKMAKSVVLVGNACIRQRPIKSEGRGVVYLHKFALAKASEMERACKRERRETRQIDEERGFMMMIDDHPFVKARGMTSIGHMVRKKNTHCAHRRSLVRFHTVWVEITPVLTSSQPLPPLLALLAPSLLAPAAPKREMLAAASHPAVGCPCARLHML